MHASRAAEQASLADYSGKRINGPMDRSSASMIEFTMHKLQ
jgi:hypothetical protein